MPKTLYELYAPYYEDRATFTKGEAARVEKARAAQTPEAHSSRLNNCYFEDDRFHFYDPVKEAIAAIAYDRGSYQRHWYQPDMPHILGLDREFPGVDPEGCFSRKDMELTARLSQIRTAAGLCPEPNRTAVTELFWSMEQRSHPLRHLQWNAKAHFRSVRDTEMAAMVCPDREVSRILEAAAGKLERESIAIRTLDAVVQVMEQLTGLREGPVLQDHKTVMQQLTANQGPYINLDRAPTGAQVVIQTSRESLDIPFGDFDNVLSQNWYADPRNWGRSPHRMYQELKDSPALDDTVDRYATGTVRRQLDALFLQTDRRYPVSDWQTPTDRGGLIIVDGKTVMERMAEHYREHVLSGRDFNHNSTQAAFRAWYKENVAQMSAQMVAGALMAGKRVEVFLPDAKGRLPQNPMQLTRSGYEPSPLKPVVMNAWQRFWSRHGFYQELKTQSATYNRAVAARERVQAGWHSSVCKAAGPTSTQMQKAFFADVFRQTGIESCSQLRSILSPQARYASRSGGRSSYVSLCVAAMAARGDVPVEEIFDLSKHTEIRREVGRQVFALLSSDPQTGQTGATREQMLGNDYAIGQLIHRGQTRLLSYVDTVMDGHSIGELDHISRNLPVLSPLSTVLCDLSQESSDRSCKVLRDGINAAAGSPEAAKQDGDRLSKTYLLLGTQIDALESRLMVASPVPHNYLSHLMTLAKSNFVPNIVTEDPNLPFTQRIGNIHTLFQISNSMLDDPGANSLAKGMEALYSKWPEATRYALAGNVDKGLTSTPREDLRSTLTVSKDLKALFPAPQPQAQPQQPHR